MRFEQHIVAAWMARLGGQVESDVIRTFDRMGATRSGDEPPDFPGV